MSRIPDHDAAPTEAQRLRHEQREHGRRQSEREMRFLLELAEAEADLYRAEQEYAQGGGA